MEYISKYKAEEIEAILDAKNNTGEGVDSNLDGLFVGQLQTKAVEVSEDTTIKADEGFLGLKEVSVKVSGGGGTASSWRYFDCSALLGEDKGGIVPMFGQVVRLILEGNDVICPSATRDIDLSKVVAFGFDTNSPYRNSYMGGITNMREFYEGAGGDAVFQEIGIVEITEEEFINKSFA